MTENKQINGATWIQDTDGVWRLIIDNEKLRPVYWGGDARRGLKGYRSIKDINVLEDEA